MIWEVENLGSEATLATGSSDGDQTQPPGAAGGLPGPLSSMYKVSGGERILLQTHRNLRIAPGEVLGKVSGGGGGVGEPSEREPRLVLEDVIDGFVTAQFARDVYRVAIDEASLTVDEAATADLRGPA